MARDGRGGRALPQRRVRADRRLQRQPARDGLDGAAAAGLGCAGLEPALAMGLADVLRPSRRASVCAIATPPRCTRTSAFRISPTSRMLRPSGRAVPVQSFTRPRPTRRRSPASTFAPSGTSSFTVEWSMSSAISMSPRLDLRAGAGRARRSRARRGRRTGGRSSRGRSCGRRRCGRGCSRWSCGSPFVSSPNHSILETSVCQTRSEQTSIVPARWPARTAPPHRSPWRCSACSRSGRCTPTGCSACIRLWGKDQVVNVGQRASLYKTIQRLQRAGLDRRAPHRARPPLPGAHRLRADRRGPPVRRREWLTDMLAVPRNEFPQFPAALSFAMLLGPGELLARARAPPARSCARAWRALDRELGGSTTTCRG